MTVAKISRKDIEKSFRAAGCIEADTVMFHSSLKSMGYVEGGPASVYDGILDAAGSGGTVAVPSLWYNGNPEECPKEKFDVKTSPTFVGVIPETFRRDPRALRSNNFSHSVCAIGARAQELTADHGKGRPYPAPWNEQAFAEISPWSKLYQWDALYCFIGVDMTYCTMKHYIESRFIDGLLRQLPPERYMEFRSKIASDCKSVFWFFYPSGKMQLKLEERGLVKKVPLGNTTLLSIRTRPLVDVTLDILRHDPQQWCTPEFFEWICQVQRAVSSSSPGSAD